MPHAFVKNLTIPLFPQSKNKTDFLFCGRYDKNYMVACKSDKFYFFLKIIKKERQVFQRIV